MAQSAYAASIKKRSIARTIVRWTHIIFGIPIVGYIYSPFKELPNYAPVVRYIAIPVILLSGLWMWKGHVLPRLISKQSAYQDAVASRSVAMQEDQ